MFLASPLVGAMELYVRERVTNVVALAGLIGFEALGVPGVSGSDTRPREQIMNIVA